MIRRSRSLRSSRCLSRVIACLLAILGGQSVLACQYTEAPEAVGQTSGAYFAKVMTGEASYVDLVLVEDDGTRPLGEPNAGVITVRTIARLKGNSADRFSLFGRGLTLKPEAETVFKAPLLHFTSEAGQVTPFAYNEERPARLVPQPKGGQPPMAHIMTSCSPPELAAQTGRFYVVMRGDDGRLLNAFRVGNTRVPAFGFVPVTLDPGDFWLGAVRRAALASPFLTKPRNLLNLRPGSNPTMVEAAIRRAGARIRAAYFRDGDLIDEIRPADVETQAIWLSRAAAFVGQRGKGRIADPNHSAAEYLRAKLGPMQRYGGGLGYEVAQAFVTSVRQTHERSGTKDLVALEIDREVDRFAREVFLRATGRWRVARLASPRSKASTKPRSSIACSGSSATSGCSMAATATPKEHYRDEVDVPTPPTVEDASCCRSAAVRVRAKSRGRVGTHASTTTADRRSLRDRCVTRAQRRMAARQYRIKTGGTSRCPDRMGTRVQFRDGLQSSDRTIARRWRRSLCHRALWNASRRMHEAYPPAAI